MADRIWVIAGAGAVGRPMGLALERAGESVAFLPRKGRTPDATEFSLHHIRDKSKAGLQPRWIDEVPTMEALAGLLVCVRSDQLPGFLEERAGEIRALGRGAPVIYFQPGFRDRTRVEEALPHATIIQGNPGFLSYIQDRVTHYWTPRGSKTMLSPLRGERAPALADHLTRLFLAGGLPATLVPDLASAVQAPFAFAMPYLAALEPHDYSLDRLAEDRRLVDLATDAGFEALEIGRAISNSPPWWTGVLRHLPAAIIRGIVPFALHRLRGEPRKMWELHAGKLRQQTRGMVGDLVAEAEVRGMPTAALRRLSQEVWGEVPG